ncbi:MAG: mechanosensitive ion channel [Bacteroidaceae bacterium]|nr:mechanosensitive ion channel [Bacteroidaceae bacterium]
MGEETIASTLTFDLSKLALSDLVSFGTTFCKNVILALLVFMVGRFVIKRVVVIADKIMERKKMEPSLYSFLNSLLSITLNLVLAILIIGIMGIETSSFVALFASAGVAIGMALSGTLQNFAGGVMVLIFKPYKVGDYIEAQGFGGVVKEIQIFNTILTTPDNQTIIIPNNSLSTSSMKNYSTAPFRRVDIDVDVCYGTDTAALRQLLQEVVDRHPMILKNADYPTSIPLTTLKESSISYQIRVWVQSADYWTVKFELTEQVYNTLRVNRIAVPYHQVDVHIKTNS